MEWEAVDSRHSSRESWFCVAPDFVVDIQLPRHPTAHNPIDEARAVYCALSHAKASKGQGRYIDQLARPRSYLTLMEETTKAS